MTDIFGGLCLGPHSSLYTGVAITVTHGPAPQQTGDSRHRLMGRLVPWLVDSFSPSGFWTGSQSAGVLLKLGGSKTGACKQEGRVSQEAPGSEKGQKAARA